MADDEHGGAMLARQREHAPLHERPNRGVVAFLRDTGHRDRGVHDDQRGRSLFEERDDLRVVCFVRQIQRFGGDERDGQVLGEAERALEELAAALLFLDAVLGACGKDEPSTPS